MRLPPAGLRIPASPGPVIGSLCTGAGGLDLGALAALDGGRLAWCADDDPHIRALLETRAPDVPNLGDLRTVNWDTVEPVDLLTAGFPCQDISAAGKRAGIEKGTRSGLWSHIVEAVRALAPALVLVENVAALRWRNGGLHRVLADLAAAGYDTCWRSVRAADIGAAHRRERVFLLAWPHHPIGRADAADAAGPGRDTAGRQRSSSTPGGRTAGEPARRHHLDPTAAANPDSGRSPLGGDPDRDGLRSGDPRRVCHAHRLGAAAADPASLRQRHGRTPPRRGVPATAIRRSASASPEDTAAHPASQRRDQRVSTSAWLEGRPDAALCGHPDDAEQPPRLLVATETRSAEPNPSAAAARCSTCRGHRPCVAWGEYAAAISRWERVFGRAAPCPVVPGQRGRPVLAPAFVEWLMGLPPGWVTDLPLPRTAQLRALGNGVVPQQAAHALRMLLLDQAHHVYSATKGTAA